MINVLHITPALKKGGIEKLLQQWEQATEKNGVRFSFAVYRAGGDTYDYFMQKGYQIYKIRQLKACGYRSYKNMIKKIIDESQADIVHINAGPITWIALYSAKAAGVRHRFIHAHTNLFPTDKGNLKSKVIHGMSVILNYKYSTLALACSNEAGKYCFGDKKFVLLKNGINIEAFNYDSQSRRRIRKKLGIAEEFIVGFVGRLTVQKNPFFALKVFKEVCVVKPDARFLIIGEGEFEQEMHTWCKQNRMEENVYFCGITDEIAAYYSAMDCLLVPSLYEGLPLTTVEALTSGLKVIASTHVPREAGINENISFMCLEVGAKEWAKEVIASCGRKRRGSALAAQRAGYDEKETSQKLMDIYKKAMLNR